MILRNATGATAAGLLALLLLAACAANPEEEERASAYKDFIEVAELRRVSSVATFGEIKHEIVDAEYVIMTIGEDHYLLEYASPCRAEDPFTRRVRPDVRRDARRLYSGVDTYRGCRIRALYEVSEDQLTELREMGLAPGEKPRPAQDELPGSL